MSAIEDYHNKLPEILEVGEDEIITCFIIPADMFIDESLHLYTRSGIYAEFLFKAGLKPEVFNDIPFLAGALDEAESRYMARMFPEKETRKLWKDKVKEAFLLREYLVRELCFAYGENKGLAGRIPIIGKSLTCPGMIHDLYRLVIAGKKHLQQPEKTGFPDKAFIIAYEALSLYAHSAPEHECKAEKKIRDQAFTLLKRSVNDVCKYGKYVFRENDIRRREYENPYLHGCR